jgi:hypothetical protein
MKYLKKFNEEFHYTPINLIGHDALDKRDFDRVKFLSKYLKESSNFEIMRYLKLFKNF